MIKDHIGRIVSRFGFAVVMQIGFVYFVLDAANGIILRNFERSQQLAFAFLTSAVLAVAGALFREGHQSRRFGLLFGWVLPFGALVTVAAAPSIAVHRELVLAGSVLWLSAAAHIGVRGKESAFAWFNRVAVWEGLLALLLASTLSAALVAIETALSTLFGFRHLEVVEYGVPLALCLVGPLFWLGRLPLPNQYKASASERDFLARSLNLIGAWAVTPFLFIYGAILLAYMGQMIVLWRLPSNTIGWMVLAFLITGTTNWLLLAGSDDWPHIRLFRRCWFWLTLPPLLLLIYAAFLRVDAYGVTPNRVVLMVGAIWGLVLAAFYIWRRGDLRLIPFLGAIGLVAIAVGPLNLNVVSARDQAARLTAVLEAAGVNGLKTARPLTPRESSIASAAMTQLYFAPGTKPILDDVLARFGIVMPPEQYPYDLMQALGYQGTREALDAEEGTVTRTSLYSQLDHFPPLDLESTPVFLGQFDLPQRHLIAAGPLRLGYEDEDLLIANADEDPSKAIRLSIEAWLLAERQAELGGRPIAFTHRGVRYLAMPTVISVDRFEKDADSWFKIRRFNILLFRARQSGETEMRDGTAKSSESAP